MFMQEGVSSVANFITADEESHYNRDFHFQKHKNKMTYGKTYNKSPRRINHKATKSKTNTGNTANFTLGPDATQR